MKTRQELILDFMLALAPNWQKIQSDLLTVSTHIDVDEPADLIREYASALADNYLRNVA